MNAADSLPTGIALLHDPILNKGTAAVESGVAFLQAEIPDVIRQLLTWKAVEAGVWAALQIGVVLLCLHGYRQARNAMVEADEWGGDWRVIFTGFTVAASAPFVFCAIFNLTDVLQILIAPKIYLIEYAASLAK